MSSDTGASEPDYQGSLGALGYDTSGGAASDYLANNPDVAASGMDPYRHYYLHGMEEGREWSGAESSSGAASAFTIAMPDLTAYTTQLNTLLEEYKKEQEEAAAEYKKQVGEQSRDSLISDYVTAAEAASMYISNEVANERSNAALLGLDYTLTDAQYQQRLSDYFATIWSGSQQTDLEAYLTDYGTPETFQWSLQRGNPDNYNASKNREGSQQTESTTKVYTVLDDENYDAVGSSTLVS